MRSPNPVDDLLGRLRQAVRDSGRAQVVIARDLGITQKHMSMIMHQRAYPSWELARRMFDLLES